MKSGIPKAAFNHYIGVKNEYMISGIADDSI